MSWIEYKYKQSFPHHSFIQRLDSLLRNFRERTSSWFVSCARKLSFQLGQFIEESNQTQTYSENMLQDSS